MEFKRLTHQIIDVSSYFRQSAVRAINTHLTLRNWIIGAYIVEYEQHGKDRAEYGENLLGELAAQIKTRGLSETLSLIHI